MSAILADESARAETAGEDRPLTDDERKLLTRLLSDPFSIPMPFKTWLVSFLEGSELLLPRSSVQGLTSLLGSGGGTGVLGLLPAGLLFPYAGGVVPAGAFLCDGTTRSRTQYKRLWDAIGSSWGGGDGSTTFNLPDLRRRVPWGSGTGVPVAATDGVGEASRTIDHNHDIGTQTTSSNGSHSHGGGTGGVGDHSHPLPGYTGNIFNMNPITNANTGFLQAVGSGNTHGAGGHSHTIGSDGGHTHTFSGNTGGGGLKNHSAYAVVAFLINW